MESADRFRKLCISCTVFFTNFGLGCCLNLMSPLVIALSEKFGTDVPSVSFVFTLTTSFYLLAAMSSTFIHRYLRRHLCLIISASFVSLAILLLPHVRTISIFYVLGALMGFGWGGCDTAQITWIIEIWREKAPPFILTQHFVYSLGTMMPSLILGHFLRAVDLTDPNATTNDIDLVTPFTIAGCLMASAVLVQVTLFWHLLKNPETLPPEQDPLLSSPTPKEPNAGPLGRRTIGLVILSCCLIGFYQALEMTTLQFLPTFSVYSQVALTQAEGAQVLFATTLSFALSRCLGILIVLKIRPHFILWVNFTLIVLANVILYALGQGSVGWLWTGCCLLGVGMSTVYPSFYAFIERHVHITTFIVSCITVSGGLVGSIYPIVVGRFVEGNPSVFNYVIFLSSTVIISCFSLIRWITRDK